MVTADSLHPDHFAAPSASAAKSTVVNFLYFKYDRFLLSAFVMVNHQQIQYAHTKDFVFFFEPPFYQDQMFCLMFQVSI